MWNTSNTWARSGETQMPDAIDSEPVTTQIRFGGVGGQGIVLAGRMLGKAAALFDGKEAVCTESYGPEARGGASRADVIISDAPIDYPFVIAADVLAVLFQEAYSKFRGSLAKDGRILVDTALVRPFDEDAAKVAGIPATQIAEELGNRLATNVVMLGYLVARTNVVSLESIEQAIRTTLQPRVIDLNLKAFAEGIDYATQEAVQ